MHKQLRDMELLSTHPWCYLQRAAGEDLTDNALIKRGVRQAKLELSGALFSVCLAAFSVKRGARTSAKSCREGLGRAFTCPF